MARPPLAHDVDDHPVMGTIKEAQAAARLLASLEDSGLHPDHEAAARAVAMKALSDALRETEQLYRDLEAEGGLRSHRTP